MKDIYESLKKIFMKDIYESLKKIFIKSSKRYL